MSNLLQRTPFLEETASLFTDEKTANARTKVIDWLNEAALADKTKKCEIISKVQELIINSESELLDEFIDNILAFSQDAIQDVKRSVIGFIEAVCKTNIKFLPRVISILALLLRDNSPQVQKRVIQACAAVYRNALQWICTSAEITDSVEQAWNTLCNMKAQILDMIDDDNDGIRTNAIKYLEGIVILQTYPDEDSMKRENDFSLEDVPMTLKIVRRRKLEDEAINIFDLLLKFHAASHISSVNLIACTGTLCTIAKMRPSLMNPVVEALHKLNSNLPPTLTDSQVSSVRKHLKMQLLNILKHPASYEMQSTVIQLLVDLGSSTQEISRAIPKLDKIELQRRAKRALEHATTVAAKKAKLDKEVGGGTSSKIDKIEKIDRPMEIDDDEVAEQIQKSNYLNEASILEQIQSSDVVVQLVMAAMVNLPNDVPMHFIENYKPIVNMTHTQQMQKIAQLLAEQMTEKRLGPGASAITKDPPMRPKVTPEEEKSIIHGLRKEPIVPEPVIPMEEDPKSMELEETQTRKDEATKKLRDHLERTKGEQSIIPKMKQRVKTLKLQEVTKPIPRHIKEQFLIDAVTRILNAEKQSMVGGVAAKRRKILTVLASTFSPIVRDIIVKFIFDDIKARFDLAFSWLYEEYSLFQGFTRHSYIKSENKPDYAYNSLFSHLVAHVIDHSDLREKEKYVTKIFLEAPLLPDEAIEQLISICELEDLSDCAMRLIKDLILRRPPKKERFLKILLKYSTHSNIPIREKAVENIITLYAVHKILMQDIEMFSLNWLDYLEKDKPPADIFSADLGRPDVAIVWNEDLAKVCLSLFLALLPYREELVHNLCRVYTNTSSDMKRTILRAIEGPIRKMGPDSYELLRLVETCPKGAETLITRVIYILTEKTAPTAELVIRVRELYQNKVSDVRLLIPVLSGLTKKEILLSLPRFIKLNPIVVKEVFNRLLCLGHEFAATPMPVTPTELLVALHTIDTAKVELKFIVKATSLCLAEKDTYTHDVLAVVLQQLVEMNPLPTLLMRTVIQSLSLYPRLAGFVTNLLQRLILKQVWKQKVVWDGFLKCCHRLIPQSLPVLIQLPASQLQDALNLCPELRLPLLEHAKTITEIGTVSAQTMDILQGKDKEEPPSVPQVITSLSAVASAEDMIEKKEEVVNPDVDQPLPPGED